MSNNGNECPKMLLNVDQNVKIVIESDLCANVRFFALRESSFNMTRGGGGGGGDEDIKTRSLKF